MKIKLSKLDSNGFLHDIIAIFIVLIVAVIGSAYLVASHADSTTSQSASASNINTTILPGYTKIGTISPDKLYNVKAPPPKSEQVAMSVYACSINLGSQNYQVSFMAILKQAVPNSVSHNWFDTLDLSTSKTHNRVYASARYSNNNWVPGSGGSTSSSTSITSAAFNLTAASDLYAWAEGSYQGTVFHDLGIHPSVSKLSACMYTGSGSTLSSGQSLLSSQYLKSGDGQYRFVLQVDGNFVIYNSSNQAIWVSNTAGSGGTRLVLQADGNLVLYNGSGQTVWNSNTAGTGANRLVMQDDGTVVLYTSSGAAVWRS